MLGNTYMVSESLTAVLVKSSVFWNMTQSRTGNRYQCFRGKYCLHLQGTTRKKCGILILSLDYPDDGGRKFYQNLIKY